MLHGIDVSRWQGKIDWGKVKESGIDFAILKCSQGTRFVDSTFEYNYANAKKNGISVGCYHYLEASNVDGAIKECDYLMSIITNKSFEFPIFLDMEHKTQQVNTKSKNSEIVIAFCRRLEQNGYWAGLYSNTDWLTNKMNLSEVDRFSVWRAHYRSDRSYEPLIPKISASECMWQYSSSGKIDGINGNVDMNVCYVDFPKLIKEKGLNKAKVDDNGSNVEETKFKVGDSVKIKSTAQKWATGQKIPSYVKIKKYKITQIKGENALLSDVISWISMNDISKA